MEKLNLKNRLYNKLQNISLLTHTVILPRHKNLSKQDKQLYATKDMPKITASMHTLENGNSYANLIEIQKQFKGCTKCELSQQRTNIVFGSGYYKAKLLIIGEAPGQEEDKSGLPFVGRAGKLLRSLLESISLTAESVYITNIVKCRPPSNRVPHQTEIFACSPVLLNQIACIKPKLILLLGKTAINFFFPEIKVMDQVRQKILTWQDYSIVCTYHPAYILRSRSQLNRIWEDFKVVKSFLNDVN